MKSIKTLLIILFAYLSLASSGSDTLYYRFNNFYVADGTPNDTLILEVEIKSSTSGTYLISFQTDIYFNTSVFGINAQPVTITPLAMVGPAVNLPAGPVNPTTNSFRYGMTQLFPPYDPAQLSLVPSTSWGKLIRYKMLIQNNSGNVGLQFNLTAMAGQTKFVKVLTSTSSNYAPLVAVNDLLNVPATLTNFSLMITELGDPNNSSADFVEIYNAGANSVNFSGYPWFLTVYNGTTYQNVQLTGTINVGDSYVIGGASYTAAYPGKPADQIAAIVDNNGNVAHYITMYEPYYAGKLIDFYNGIVLPFTGKHAVRHYVYTSPNTSFTFSEWIITNAANIDMTPGSHRVTLTWDGSSSTNWRDTANWTLPYVPDAGHNASIPNADVTAPDVQTGTQARCHDLIISGSTSEEEFLRKSIETSGKNR